MNSTSLDALLESQLFLLELLYENSSPRTSSPGTFAFKACDFMLADLDFRLDDTVITFLAFLFGGFNNGNLFDDLGTLRSAAVPFLLF